MARSRRSASPDDSGRRDGLDEEPTESIDYRDPPTQYAGYVQQGQPEPGPLDPLESPDLAAPRNATPWFRRRPVLIAWITLIILMIALVIWGIIQLTNRGPGDTTVPSTTSPAGTTTTAATSTPTTATTATTATSTTRTPANTGAAPPPAAPGESPSRRHHLPPLPSVITIPPIPRAPEVPTVITLPPHL